MREMACKRVKLEKEVIRVTGIKYTKERCVAVLVTFSMH